MALKPPADHTAVTRSGYKRGEEPKDISLRNRFLCWYGGHDSDIVSEKDDPRPREYLSNGRPKLRKALLHCVRCGVTY